MLLGNKLVRFMNWFFVILVISLYGSGVYFGLIGNVLFLVGSVEKFVVVLFEEFLIIIGGFVIDVVGR